MTEKLSSMGSMPKDAKKTSRTSSRATPGERAAVPELVKAARAYDEDITGPDGRLKSFTATVLSITATVLEEEMTDHLGHAKHRATEGAARMSVSQWGQINLSFSPGTSATAPGPRRCSRMRPVRSPSRCRGTGRARSSR